MATEEFTDAIALLKADHRKVEELFEKVKTAKGAQKQKLVTEICNELTIHMMLEEEIFYPAVEGKIEQDDVAEAYIEHDASKVLMKDIIAEGQDDEYYDAKVHVLSEEVLHHVKEEEQQVKGVFAQTRKTDVDLVAMRDQMLARKEELLAQAKAGELPPPELHAVAA